MNFLHTVPYSPIPDKFIKDMQIIIKDLHARPAKSMNTHYKLWIPRSAGTHCYITVIKVTAAIWLCNRKSLPHIPAHTLEV